MIADGSVIWLLFNPHIHILFEVPIEVVLESSIFLNFLYLSLMVITDLESCEFHNYLFSYLKSFNTIFSNMVCIESCASYHDFILCKRQKVVYKKSHSSIKRDAFNKRQNYDSWIGIVVADLKLELLCNRA